MYNNFFFKLKAIQMLAVSLFCVVYTFAGDSSTSVADQQTQTVSGTVTETTGESIPGVSVVVKGTPVGVVTDADGRYIINNVSANATLVFSFVGMTTREIDVEGRTVIDVELSMASSAIDELIVVGYGTVSRRNLTTAISRVNADDVQKVASSNASHLLLGRAAGLQATVASSQPGGNVNISIRGAGTPVYVVDGVVMPQSALEPGSGSGELRFTPNAINRAGLAGINPADIESIEVLKDAAASIYGIGAANGVILITTKRGREGPMRINYEGSHSQVRNISLPNPLNATEYMDYVNIFSKEQYLYNRNPRQGAYGQDAYDGNWIAPFSPQEIADAQNYDWQGQVVQPGSINNHTLTISGGSRNVNYYVSGNYFSQTGTIVNSRMDRYTLRSNVGFNLASFLKLTSVVNINYNDYLNHSAGGRGGGRGPAGDGALGAARAYPSYLPFRDANNEFTRHLNIPNAVSMLDMMDETSTNGTFLSFIADVDILPKMLSARLQYGNNMENARRSMYIPSWVWFDARNQSRGHIGENRRIRQSMEATMMFHRNFADIVDFDIVVGIERNLAEWRDHGISYTEQYDAIANDNLAFVSGAITPVSGRALDEKRSQFTRINFDFFDRYVINGTLRRDGTDKFFEGKKYAFFPSVSLAWKASNESFLRDVSWINLLKLRASYGLTGSDNLGASLYASFDPRTEIIIFESQRYIPIVNGGLDYPDITWQKTSMQNVGVDFHLFNDRVWGSFDIFRNDITDGLGTANSSGLSMFPTYPINGSHQRRYGWDATVNSKNIVNNDFTWTTLLTLSHYKSIWVERMPNYDYAEHQVKKNESTNARYYYKTAGLINHTKSNMPEYQPLNGQFPGYTIIVDKNDDGEITIDDIYYVDATPKLYFGTGNTFSYKNWSLDIFCYARLGYERTNPALDIDPTNLSNQTNNTTIDVKNVWSSEHNPNGRLPGIAQRLASVQLPGGVGTNINYQDASFFRVRNLTLAYDISGNQLGAVGNVIGNARIYVDVQNPFIITNFDGYDPEITIGTNIYPQNRIYSVGVRVSFNN